MCGRYVVTEDAGSWTSRFDAVDETAADGTATDGTVADEGAADFNVAPTVTVPVVLCAPDAAGVQRRRLRRLRWGLVPSWARDATGPPLINARVETVAEKPSFRAAFLARRCLLPADGWYEWAVPPDGDGPRRPFHISAADGGPVAFAGLYEVSHGRWSTTILTGPAPADLEYLHHRAPMLVPPERWDAWLDPGLTNPDEIRGLLRPATPGSLRAYPVSPRVNDARQTGRDLLTPYTEAKRVDPTPVQPTLF